MKEKELRQHIETMARMLSDRKLNPGYRYVSVYAYLLDHGQIWEAQALPERVKRGTPQYCYYNAYRLAAASRGRLRYVEGMAFGIIPTEHAWCVDEHGKVIDPTWETPQECAYFGVAFPIEVVRPRHRGKTFSISVIHNWEEHYPLLKERAS